MSSDPAAAAAAVWIYHERQEARLCGQHALNNLAQTPGAFAADRLAAMAQELDVLELNVYALNNEGGRRSKEYQERLQQGSLHVDQQGNFSIEVLKAAVMQEYGVALPHLMLPLPSSSSSQSNNNSSNSSNNDITAMQGFLCHKSDHWFAIRNIGGRFWNLDSVLERPVVVSHFALAVEMIQWQSAGYTVFSIATGLPAGGVKRGVVGPQSSQQYQHSGSSSNNNSSAHHSGWHLMSDLLQGKSTGADPWEKLSGAGMRLDGQQQQATNVASQQQQQNMVVEGLTEDEMFQLALQASLTEQHQQPQPPNNVRTVSSCDNNDNHLVVVVSPEPPDGAPGAVRIQFRLPVGGGTGGSSSNKRIVRRFCETDCVASIYAFVEQQQQESSSSARGTIIELRYGFPPKDLHGLRGVTIREANLANETIQGRYL